MESPGLARERLRGLRRLPPAGVESGGCISGQRRPGVQLPHPDLFRDCSQFRNLVVMVAVYRHCLMALPDFSTLDASAEDRVRWFQLSVEGRPAVGGVAGGNGPPVVFLHGWALGSHAYKRAISRLVARGCRVFAPALPSFGGTRDLPRGHSDLDGYARWAAAFMDEVGIDEPAVLIGHSFGGGVALKLAELRRELVSYLVLLNAVGGVSPRPPWEWLSGLSRELWPPTTAFDLARAVQSDLVPNLVGNPFGLVRAAGIAWRADLLDEAEKVRASGVPVLVLTGRTDGVIPRRAFESLCEAIGTTGRVVEGGHSWMLADPDSLAATMAPVVDRLVDEHRSSQAVTRTGKVADLLADSHIPKRFVTELIGEAPPLWVLSESASVLAADIALCYPAPVVHEVRAIARPIAGSEATRLTIVTTDRKGLLADSSAVLASNGLSITHASAATWTRQKIALHSFVIDSGQNIDQSAWDEVGRNLEVMAATRSLPPVTPPGPVRVTVHGGDKGQMLATVSIRDEIGALSRLCRVLSDHDINIESLHARSANGRTYDTFLLVGVHDQEALADLFSRPARAGLRRCTDTGRSARGPLTGRRRPEPPHLISIR